MMRYLLLGDCAEKMRDLAANSIDAIVTDPPYALTGSSGSGGFMGAKWDSALPTVDMWREALRVAKPGAHLLAFGGTRTYHRLACAIEDAGWEIRECCMWVHSQGFPKGQNVAKQIEALLKRKEFAPEMDAAKAWEGWNTQLKPALEPIVVARKPLEGTVAANVLKYGTGALNIDACRVPLADDDRLQNGVYHNNPVLNTQGERWGFKNIDRAAGLGRFPANLIHDGSDEVLALFPESKGAIAPVYGKQGNQKCHTGDNGIYGHYEQRDTPMFPRGDSGSAARFFYCAKASRSERNKNCERLLQWEQDQELTQLLEKSNQLLQGISESMMQMLDAIVCNTTLFGSGISEQSPEECAYTISMALKLITELKTLCASPTLNTNGFILDAIKTSEESGINVVQLAERLNLLKLDSTNGEMATAINAVNALFAVLSEIRGRAKQGNHHCTIKPLALMRYLVRLVTRKGGIVLDPFMGSGTTGVAAIEEGMNFVGIEREPHYHEIATRRISAAKPEPTTPTQPELPL